MDLDLNNMEVWFVTGSQDLYGDEVLQEVKAHSRKIVKSFCDTDKIPIKVVFKPVVTTAKAIKKLILEANSAQNCIGLITWMHTFSPAQMWIAGLKSLQKPFVHLHTQFNREIPWSDIDMDFMNLNQSAHGGREFGFMVSRLRLNRKVIVGHWQEEEVLDELSIWIRAACAWHDAQEMKIARFGDNMRRVAVTEGDKVEARIQLGYTVNGYGLGDLVEFVDNVTDREVEQLISEYMDKYSVDDVLCPDGKRHQELREAARIELGMRSFLKDGDFKGFTTTFENLQGLKQLPGLASQRLMAAGYGFGAEGDWKTAALVRSMKVMAAGLDGGTSFMEDYTYHLQPGDRKVLGAHMLEVCESIAGDKPSLEMHPLSIGGKADPARLVFNARTGPAVNATIVDMGNRFRMIANNVRVVNPEESLPSLPVARAVWKPEPGLRTAAKAWILAGGAHHAGFSQVLTAEHLRDFAEIADIEFLLIDKSTDINQFKKELRWNESCYR